MVDPGCGARCAIRDTGAPGAAHSIGRLPCLARPSQWRQGRLESLGKHAPWVLAYVEAGEPSSRGGITVHGRGFFWRVFDALDYWVMQVRLWQVDALYGPEPETEADRQRGRDHEPWRRSGLRQPPG
jgi:hypothetical protein